MEKRSGEKAMGCCCGTGAAKKAKTAKKASKANVVPEDEDETTLTLSMEPEVLDCGICFLPFESQVYMCKNGHCVCANCCLGVNGKCSWCAESIGDIRCRPLESLLASATTSCKFKSYGCGEAARYAEKRRHEEYCPRAPYDCPIDGCSYRGRLLCSHIVGDHAPDAYTAMGGGGFEGTTVTLHKAAPSRVLLQRCSGRVFLLLNRHDLLTGRSLSMLCVGPRLVAGVELKYEMEVSGGGPGQLLLLSASGTVPCARRLEGFQPQGSLFVPDAYWGSAGTVSARVREFATRRRVDFVVCCHGLVYHGY